jgi:hypothetical protein
MSLKIVPPFKLALRVPDDGAADSDELNLRRLREVVAGRDASIPRRAAMALLLSSGAPDADQDLAAVLENDREPGRIRYLAALALAEIDTPAARDTLVRNLSVSNARARAGVLVGLGRVGGAAELEAVSRLSDDSPEGRFAAALIAHRLGAGGHDLPVPDESDLATLGDDARPMEWQQPAPAEVELCLRDLAGVRFGVELAREPASEIRCGRRMLLALVNRDFAGPDSVARMRERKALAGVVAMKNETDGRYSISLLILTAPDGKEDGFRLLLYRTSGDLVYAGSVRASASPAEFSLRAVARPGVCPIRLDGLIRDGRVEIRTALAATHVLTPRRPTEGSGPRAAVPRAGATGSDRGC